MFFIKKKIKANLINLTDSTADLIETNAIINKNKISYHFGDTSYKITLSNNQLLLVRENEDFIHKFLFDIDNITKSEYYIKELRTTIELSIKTTKLTINEERIIVEYDIIDSENKYSYILDME